MRLRRQEVTVPFAPMDLGHGAVASALEQAEATALDSHRFTEGVSQIRLKPADP